jgi:hypothetical protein
VICEDARRFIGAEPSATSSELAEHLKVCHACTEFQLEMVALEANIRRALEEPPAAAPGRRRASARPRWALAASVVLVLTASIVIWALRTENSLAHDLVAHVVAEPQSWAGTDAVPEDALEDVLRKSGLVLDATPYSVVYARSCWFRGHYVPHLVVRTAHNLVTVLILHDENVAQRQSFHEDGLSGVIVPSARGSIAVLAAGSVQLDDLAERMRLAVRSQNGQ